MFLVFYLKTHNKTAQKNQYYYAPLNENKMRIKISLNQHLSLI